MAIVVEDGNGLVNAQSYISVADADTYDLEHQIDTVWGAATTAAKEQALKLATQYLDMVYHLRWKGQAGSQEQALDWPRLGVRDDDSFVIDSSILPQRLKDAEVEAAIAQINGDELLPDVTVSNSGTLTKHRVKVGPIEEDKEFSGGGQSLYKIFSRVDSLLLGLIESGGQISRA